MKKLLTALYVCVLALACVFTLPIQGEATTENDYMHTVTTVETTIARSAVSGDIDVPFDPIKKVRILWVATKPAKVEYQFGEKLDTTGMVVKATYSDASSAEVTNYTVSGYSADLLGEQTITVTFGGKTAKFTVTVIPYTYTVDNGEATITGYTGAGGDITFPVTLGGYPVTTIGDSAFSNCENLSDITYPGTKCQWEKVVVCDNNDDLLAANWIFSKGEHSFTNYVSDENATCLEDGTKTAKCEFCDATDTQTDAGSKLGHSFTNYISNNDATYEADGTKTAKCDRCEETDTVTDSGTRLQAKNGWALEDNKWYYYKNNIKQTGWVLDGGVWYYMNSGGVMQTGWLQQGNVWYYLNSSGAMATGWKLVGGTYYYFNTSGVMQTGWLKSGNTWYYLKSSGAMATGWAQVSGVWYYFNSSGAMVTGWQKVGSTWYYFQSSGAMVTGWQKVGSTWYYFQSSGAMVTGWQKVGSTWYYFQFSGAMVTGWLKLGNTWYYFHSSGAMANANCYIGGKLYRFSASGVWLG